MKSVIVGTAGHIDHGKTALVKALTGIDADRLDEEKRRGITIDIGFAHMELSDSVGGTVRFGFVDVPGHERFVRNMLAGIGGIDFVLLVIAADESIKPQTREHFDICRMLNIRTGITVLTKADLVDQDTLEVVRMEVEEFVRGSFLETAPILAVSSLTGQGLDELKREMLRVAGEVPEKQLHAVLRLPIDRVFTMKGFGTVVTGTLISGHVRKEEEVEVFPTGQRVRVRGIQVHSTAADEARAGQRTALNLAGATTEELARGMMLAPVGLFRSTRRVDVQLNLLPGARPLKDRARVHFHCYTAEMLAEVALLGAPNDSAQTATSGEQSGQLGPTALITTQQELRPGATAWVQLRLSEPALLLPGDRFILRQFSPVVTIGGGIVVDATPLPPRMKPDAKVELQHLETLLSGPDTDRLIVRTARRGHKGLSLSDAIAETGWTRAQLEVAMRPVVLSSVQLQQVIRDAIKLSVEVSEQRATGIGFTKPPRLVLFGDLLVSDQAVAVTAVFGFLEGLKTFHDVNPLVAGISKEELREKLDLGPEIFNGILDALVREKKLEVIGEQVRLAGRGVVMKDEESESKQLIEQAFATAGLKVPSLKEVLAGLKVDRVRAQKIVTLLLRDRVLIKISEDLVFHREALDALRKQVAAYKASSAKIDVAKFKELTGVSRKYAIPLLEYLDRERVTRRMGDERVIL